MHKFDIKNIDKLDNPNRRTSMPPEETLLKFNVKDDGSLLDVGCGLGYFAIPAAMLLKTNLVIGIDILPEMIEIAEHRAKGIGNIQFKKSDEYSFPVETESMKYVLISNVIHEVEDKLRYLNEIKRVLKENGYALIIDWAKKETEMGPPVTERVSSEEMIDISKQAGFIFIEEVNISENHYGLKLQKAVNG